MRGRVPEPPGASVHGRCTFCGDLVLRDSTSSPENARKSGGPSPTGAAHSPRRRVLLTHRRGNTRRPQRRFRFAASAAVLGLATNFIIGQPRSRAIVARALSGLTATGWPTVSSMGRSVAESE